MAGRVLADADEAAGHLPLEAGAHGEVARVRSAEAHGDAESLRRADRDVRAQLAGRGDDREGEQVGRDDREAAGLVHARDDGARVPDAAGGARVLDEGAERVGQLGRIHRGEVVRDQLDAERGGAAVEERARLRQGVGVDEEDRRLGLGGAARASSMPSTTAVASSSMDAFAVASPDRSATIVWKLMSASSRPCEISGWYGV